MKVLGATALRKALPMADTIAAMKRAFEAFSSGAATVPQRIVLDVPASDGIALIKPAFLPGEGLGAKLVSVFPNNTKLNKPVISGIVVLLDPATGEPIGLCDGTFLTAWRTGAASGAATDLLANHDARIGSIIGCGVQGRTQAIAIDSVRDLQVIRCFDMDAAKMEELREELQPQLGARIEAVSSPEEAVHEADIICTATTSKAPVIDFRWLKFGAHINGVGSFTPSMREIDPATIEHARIFVDSRDAALAEAGELIHAVSNGLTHAEEWTEIGDVVGARQPGRSTDDEITFFKSVGLAAQDIAAAALAFERAEKLGLHTEIDLS